MEKRKFGQYAGGTGVNSMPLKRQHTVSVAMLPSASLQLTAAQDDDQTRQRLTSTNNDIISNGTSHASHPHDDGTSTSKAQSSIHASKDIAKPRSERVNTLLRALEDITEESNSHELIELAGFSTLAKCIELNKSLLSSLASISTPKASASAAAAAPRSSTKPPNIHNSKNPHKIPPYISIAPWQSTHITNTLPPLPPILSPTLETAVFTHSGVSSSPNTSYERLEWIGDAYLELTATLLISQTFTTYTPGKCATIRESLVKNATLAAYARNYDFHTRARLPPEFAATSNHSDAVASLSKQARQDRNKVMGDIFEAYVAGVVLSDAEHGVARVAEWLKALWGPQLKAQIADFETQHVRTGAERLSPKEQLHAALQGKDVKLTYRDCAPEKTERETGAPLFSVGVYLDGWAERDLLLGWGVARGKKEAGAKAARMALENKKLIGRLGLLKAKADEERAAVRTMGEAAGGTEGTVEL